MRLLYAIITFVLLHSLGALGVIETTEVIEGTEALKQPRWPGWKYLPKLIWSWKPKAAPGFNSRPRPRPFPKWPQGIPVAQNPGSLPSEINVSPPLPAPAGVPKELEDSPIPIISPGLPSIAKESSLSSAGPASIPSPLDNQPMTVEDLPGPKASDEMPSTQNIRDGGTCCAAIAISLPGKVVSAIDLTTYNIEITSYWAAQPREDLPSCFVTPSSAIDVSIIMKIINSANSIQEKSCPFAIKGGGHSPNPGWANIALGVTIDLVHMNQVTLSPGQDSVSIGPGARWEDVYKRLDPLEIGVTGGRVGDVGVPGLITGGGISFFTPRYGMVVLASGQIVQANSSGNQDLHTALKGGSSNFGIVTRFDMKTFKQGPYWGGLLFMNSLKRRSTFEFFERFANISDPYAAFINSYTWVPIIGAISTSNVQYTKAIPSPPLFQKLIENSESLGSTPRISTTSDFTQEIKDLNPSGSRQLFMTFSHKNSASFMETIYKISGKIYKRPSLPLVLTWSISFQPLSKKTQALSEATGGNSLGLDGSDDITLVLLTASWSTITGDTEVERAAKDLWKEVSAEARLAGVHSRFVYLNYAAKFQDPIQGYGEEVVEKLEEVAEKYDPNGVFQTALPGGFKISK